MLGNLVLNQSAETQRSNHTERAMVSSKKTRMVSLRAFYTQHFFFDIYYITTAIDAAFLLKLLPPALPGTGYYWYIPTEYLKTSNSKCFMASGIMAEVC